MSLNLPPLNALKSFEAAARTGSYVAAADELGVSPAAVSQQVRHLESYLGKTLFMRFNNRIALTDAGHLEPYLAELRRLLTSAGMRPAPEHIVVTNGRVRAGYRIGETLFGRLAPTAPAAMIHVIGERPGNGHHTFSSYVTRLSARVWATPGVVDHNHTKVISNIADTARDTIRAMDEIVWAINPKNDTLKEMADYLVHYAQDFLRPTGVACELDVPLEVPEIPLTAEVRHNLFMVVKEALHNAVKHAAPRRIKLGLEFHPENQLSIVVSDDGRGFHLDQAAAVGNGLENMNRRMREIGGELNLQSEPGQGTTVTLLLSLTASKQGQS